MHTILVVEDDPNQEYLYEEELREEGYQVLCAANGREAIRLVEEHRPDLAVLDINMPVMDGLECLGRILELQPKLPIIIYTAYPAYQDSFLSWAADAYLVKKSDLTELKACIGKLLAQAPDVPFS